MSRGITTESLAQNNLWWNGPNFLQEDQANWPQAKAAFVREPQEEKTIKTILTATPSSEDIIGTINHRNSIITWQRIVAYCIKFGSKNTHTNEPRLGSLTKEHLREAMVKIVKHCQQKEFKKDFQLLKEDKAHKTRFHNMTPIIDADGILRVGGRLDASGLPFDQRHPIILPYHHEVTVLIMRQLHLENMHAGPQALLAVTRQKYWPMKGKILAKSVVDQCILCAKAKPKLLEQVMGTLPKERVTAARAFTHTGIDYAGPITIHYQGRGSKTTKAYICVFVCFATKAVHLEAAIDQSTASFLCCLKRFISRRGAVKTIFSDNATNFVSMNNQLQELGELLQTAEHQKEVAQYCYQKEIEWKFIPPRSPHFGGLWESAVKSAKQLLTKVLHNHRLTYEELTTVLTEIEAILNSRPLTPMSDNPSDLQPLTARHFLIGCPLTAINDDYVPDTTKLQQWAKLVQIKKEFWNRWQKEYLCELQFKNKWKVGHPNVKIGTMVTMKDSNLPPLHWKLGRIIEVFPDANGVVRKVLVKTSTGVFRRAIHELSPLPVEPYHEEVKNKPTTTKSSLNVEAQEFPWIVGEKNPDMEPVNTKEVLKAAKQVEKRKQRKRSAIQYPPRVTRASTKLAQAVASAPVPASTAKNTR